MPRISAGLLPLGGFWCVAAGGSGEVEAVDRGFGEVGVDHEVQVKALSLLPSLHSRARGANGGGAAWRTSVCGK
nr:hypothetical protein CFP56_56972 [Quercus suber]